MTIEEPVERLLKNRVALASYREQCKARSKLHRVEAPENLLGRYTVNSHDGFDAIPETTTEQRVRGVRTCFVQRANRVSPGHLAVAEACDLRKNVPDPVAGLPAPTQFLDDAGIVPVLRLEEMP